MNKKFHPTLRIIASFLLVSFFLRDVAFAAIDLKPAQFEFFQKPLVNFKIPRSVALIEDAWKAPSSRESLTTHPSRRKTVFLLQDAHTNESGQLNAAKALEIILTQNSPSSLRGAQRRSNLIDQIASPSARNDIRYVFLEAGTGNDSLSFLRDKTSLEKRKEVANAYLKKGILSGSEYLDLTSDLKFVLWGVENKDLYWQALKAYEAVAKGREKFEDYLKRIQTTVDTLKPRIFNPTLMAFDTIHEKFLNEKISFTDYLDVLAVQAKKRDIELNYFVHLSALKDLKENEKAIDFKAAQDEQARVLESASSEDAEKLLPASKDNHTPFKVSSGDHKVEKAYYALLEEIVKKQSTASSLRGAKRRSLPVPACRQAWRQAGNLVAASGAENAFDITTPRVGIASLRLPKSADYARNDSRLYPNLSKYFEYLKSADKIDPKGILTEQKLLEEQIYTSLIRNDDERNLLKASANLRALKSLFELTLTPDEFQIYKEDPKGFDPAFITGFLNKKIMDLKNFYERAVFLENGYEDYVKRAEEFYELTVSRDRAFVDGLSQKMDAEHQTQAVLVAGGYHTPNLKALLKERGISYVVVTPQIYQETNHKRYEKLLLSQKTNGEIAGDQGIRGSGDQGNKMALLPVFETPEKVSLVSTVSAFARSVISRPQAEKSSSGVTVTGSGLVTQEPIFASSLVTRLFKEGTATLMASLMVVRSLLTSTTSSLRRLTSSLKALTPSATDLNSLFRSSTKAATSLGVKILGSLDMRATISNSFNFVKPVPASGARLAETELKDERGKLKENETSNFQRSTSISTASPSSGVRLATRADKSVLGELSVEGARVWVKQLLITVQDYFESALVIRHVKFDGRGQSYLNTLKVLVDFRKNLRMMGFGEPEIKDIFTKTIMPLGERDRTINGEYVNNFIQGNQFDLHLSMMIDLVFDLANENKITTIQRAELMQMFSTNLNARYIQTHGTEDMGDALSTNPEIAAGARLAEANAIVRNLNRDIAGVRAISENEILARVERIIQVLDAFSNTLYTERPQTVDRVRQLLQESDGRQIASDLRSFFVLPQETLNSLRINNPELAFRYAVYLNVLNGKTPVLASDIKETLAVFTPKTGTIFPGVREALNEALFYGQFFLMTGDEGQTVEDKLLIPDKFIYIDDQGFIKPSQDKPYYKNLILISRTSTTYYVFDKESGHFTRETLVPGIPRGQLPAVNEILTNIVRKYELQDRFSKSNGFSYEKNFVPGYILPRKSPESNGNDVTIAFFPAGVLTPEARAVWSRSPENKKLLKQLADEINREFRKSGITTIKASRGGLSTIDIIAKKASKGAALREVKRRLPDKSKFYVFLGDQINKGGNDATVLGVVDIAVQLGPVKEQEHDLKSARTLLVFSKSEAKEGAAAKYIGYTNAAHRVANVFKPIAAARLATVRAGQDKDGEYIVISVDLPKAQALEKDHKIYTKRLTSLVVDGLKKWQKDGLLPPGIDASLEAGLEETAVINMVGIRTTKEPEKVVKVAAKNTEKLANALNNAINEVSGARLSGGVAAELKDKSLKLKVKEKGNAHGISLRKTQSLAKEHAFSIPSLPGDSNLSQGGAVRLKGSDATGRRVYSFKYRGRSRSPSYQGIYSVPLSLSWFRLRDDYSNQTLRTTQISNSQSIQGTPISLRRSHGYAQWLNPVPQITPLSTFIFHPSFAVVDGLGARLAALEEARSFIQSQIDKGKDIETKSTYVNWFKNNVLLEILSILDHAIEHIDRGSLDKNYLGGLSHHVSGAMTNLDSTAQGGEFQKVVVNKYGFDVSGVQAILKIVHETLSQLVSPQVTQPAIVGRINQWFANHPKPKGTPLIVLKPVTELDGLENSFRITQTPQEGVPQLIQIEANEAALDLKALLNAIESRVALYYSEDLLSKWRSFSAQIGAYANTIRIQGARFATEGELSKLSDRMTNDLIIHLDLLIDRYVDLIQREQPELSLSPDEKARLRRMVLSGVKAGVDLEKPGSMDEYLIANLTDDNDKRFVGSLRRRNISLETKELLVLGENFIPTSELETTDRKKLGRVYLSELKDDNDVYLESYRDAAKQANVTYNILDAGLGNNIAERDIFKQELFSSKENPGVGAKGTDLYFNVGTENDPVYKNVAEIKFNAALNLAKIKVYGKFSYRPIVSDDSKSSYDKLLDEKRATAKDAGLTVVDNSEMLVANWVPVVDQKTGFLTQSKLTHRTTGGNHGQWGERFLWEAYASTDSEDGRTRIQVFANGDGPNNGVNSAIVGWMVKKQIPILMITTERTEIDAKGGILGRMRTMLGKFRLQIMELAQAKLSKQVEPFSKVGLAGGKGESGQQDFNTNVAVINETIVSKLLKGLTQKVNGEEPILTEEALRKIISPDLVENPKVKGDNAYIQLEGALASALLNLNAFFETSEDPRVKDLLEKLGLSRVLYTLFTSSKERSEFFTPIKYAWDFWLYAYTNRFKTHEDRIQDMAPQNPLPGFTLDEKYYGSVPKIIKALGKNTDARNLRSLSIQGNVQLADPLTLTGPILEGNVEIIYEGKGEINLSNLQHRADGRLHLKDVTVLIDASGSKIELKPKNGARLAKTELKDERGKLKENETSNFQRSTSISTASPSFGARLAGRIEGTLFNEYSIRYEGSTVYLRKDRQEIARMNSVVNLSYDQVVRISENLKAKERDIRLVGNDAGELKKIIEAAVGEAINHQPTISSGARLVADITVADHEILMASLREPSRFREPTAAERAFDRWKSAVASRVAAPALGVRVPVAYVSADAENAFSQEELVALETAVLKIAIAHPGELGKLLSILTNKGALERLSIQRIVDKENHIDRVTATLAKSNTKQPLITIDNARSKLQTVQAAQSAENRNEFTAAEILALVKASELNSRMAFVADTSTAPLAVVRPASLFKDLSEDEFRAALTYLFAQDIHTHRTLAQQGRSVQLFLSGKEKYLSVSQQNILDEIVQVFEGKLFTTIGEPAGFKGIVIQAVDAENQIQSLSNDGKKLFIPVGGVSEGTLLGLTRFNIMAYAIGAFYSHHMDPESAVIEFSKINALDLPGQIVDYYRSNMKDRSQNLDRATLIQIFSGQAKISVMKIFMFYLPIAKIPVNVILQGVRMTLRTIGIAA